MRCTSYSAAEAFATTKTWTLSSGAGTKTVYVQFRDGAGNWSPAFTDTIVFDTTAPTISGVCQRTTSLATQPGSPGPLTSRQPPRSSTAPPRPSAKQPPWTPLSSRRTAWSCRAGPPKRGTTIGSDRRMPQPTNGSAAATTSSRRSPARRPRRPLCPPMSRLLLSLPSRSTSPWGASTDNVGVTGYEVWRMRPDRGRRRPPRSPTPGSPAPPPTAMRSRPGMPRATCPRSRRPGASPPPRSGHQQRRGVVHHSIHGHDFVDH